ncbi:MAG: UDP-2,3-diacylglucosamine diphosphatase [Gammaproteobacteria bacterium]
MINVLISDLHLEESRPDIVELFTKFLTECVATADALYILGDFFEMWIGDDDLSPFNLMIITALKKATDQGLAIYFMHGNRDFLIGKKFSRLTGCKLLPEEYVVELAGVPILLMHGDVLCTQDLAYLKFRKKARNWFFQKFVLLQSLKRRRAIAERYRAGSKAHTSTTSAAIMDVTQSEVMRMMQKHNVQHMIHGHTHRPAVHEFELNGSTATRTVLGPWHEDGSALICKSDGSRELIVIKLSAKQTPS